MNQVLNSIYESGSVLDQAGEALPAGPSGAPRETCHLLDHLIRTRSCKQTLEIGMAYGLSTLAICQALADTGGERHVAVDPQQSSKWRSIGRLNVERARLEHLLEVHEQPSHEALPQLVQDARQFDLIFIDGKHLFDFTLVDFFYADLLVKQGGLIVFDDIWLEPVFRAVSYVASNRRYQIVPTPGYGGRGAVRWLRSLRRAAFARTLNGLQIAMLPTKVCVMQKLGNDERRRFVHRRF